MLTTRVIKNEKKSASANSGNMLSALASETYDYKTRNNFNGRFMTWGTFNISQAFVID